MIMAIIFIFAALLLAKLFQVQVLASVYYRGLADRQQKAYGKLEAKRGKIFIQDNQDGGAGGELFPLATNKQFASVYAKPNEILEPLAVAAGLYSVFDQAGVEAEVEKLVAEDEELKDSSDEFKKVKKELEVKIRREAIIARYEKILGKKGDPYEPLKEKADEDVVARLKQLNLPGIDYLPADYRYYPEKNVGSQMIGFVGYVEDDRSGRYGLEGFFERELAGSDGYIKAEKNAIGEIMVASSNDYVRPEDGSDLVLTINRSIQFEACRKLEEAALKHGADGGSIIIMEPKSGQLIAMCSWPDYDPNNYQAVDNLKLFNNPAIFHQYEPGSTFKVITMAAALDQNKVSPATTYEDRGSVMVEGWPKPIKNSDFEVSGGHGKTDMKAVLEKSLNTGAIFALEQIGAPVFVQYVQRFGFGAKTGIELETEAPGNISNLTGKKIRPINAATASFGQGITATPIQMITAYAAIANGGVLKKPYLVKEIVSAKGERFPTTPKEIRRVISERSATLLTAMLVNAVENGHAKRARVPGYYVAGKTGTAQAVDAGSKGYSDKTVQTFIGYAPVSDPKFVMLTKLDDPKDSRFAESSAVPLFGEVAKFVLNYYQVPSERNIDEVKK